MKLPARWTPLRAHPLQLAYVASPHRFNVVPAGRRSGKTERAKRKLVRRALTLDGVQHDDTPRFFAAAPTRDQAKRIYWADLKALTRPFWLPSRPPLETELTITLWHGAEISVVGMDRPERVEGSPWDGGILDEYANMKATAWQSNVRPALADRRGWCDLIGVPEGRNHYYDTYTKARALMLEQGASSEWGAYTWHSADILDPAEIAAARADLDPLTFQQEYEASFVVFAGRVYYAYTSANAARLRDRYNPRAPLIIALDFNVSPGVAAVMQELRLPNGQTGTAVIGEVWIPNDSNTPAVCRKLCRDWATHEGPVVVYGDATGGARGTAAVSGSDWEIVETMLRRGDPARGIVGFGNRVTINVPASNPTERARINAVNSRLCSVDGTRRLFVDPHHAPHVEKDFEGVRPLAGGSGEIDKKHDKKLTHISDAVGYYVAREFPVRSQSAVSSLSVDY